MSIPFDLAILLLEIYPSEQRCIFKDVYSVIAKNKRLYMSIDRRLYVMVYP